MKHQQLTTALLLLSVPSLAFAAVQEERPRTDFVQDSDSKRADKNPMYASVSELIGKDVWSRADASDESDRDDIADIRDFVIESETGRISGVILSSGGIGSIGDTLRRVEFSQLRFIHEKDGECKVWMDTTEDAFSKLASIKNDTLDPFRCKAIVAGYRDMQGRAQEAGSGEATGKAREAHTRAMNTMLASECDDLEMRACGGCVDENGKSIEGQDMGNIDEAWVNLSSGEIEYVTFEYNDRMIVIPAAMLKSQVDVEDEVVYIVSPIKNTLMASAPSIDDDKKGMTLRDADFRTRVATYYDAQGMKSPKKSK